MDLGWKYMLISLSVSLCSGKVIKVFNNVTDYQYGQMPILFHLDNYDNCLLLKSESLYCYATIQLSPLNPDNPSRIWNIIEETIKLERNYRHDRLRHGICVQEVCPQISPSLYRVGNGTNELWQGLSECYTAKYKEKGLKGQVIQMYCENDEKFYKVDITDIIYAICLTGLVIIILIATLRGNLIKKKTNATINKADKILQCFSISKNLKTLFNKPVKEDENFSAIEGIRVVHMLMILQFHSWMTYTSNATQNPKIIEELTIYPANVFFSNIGLICQTFFIISGWLSSYYICLDFQKKQFSIKDLPLRFIQRIFRMWPVMILIIGFNATWIRHITGGPLWQYIIDFEFHNCRNYFFVNLLFMNNYYNNEAICMQQTWYIAAEIQAFTIGLFIMYFVLKWPKFAGKIFTLFITLGLAIGFIDHFYHEYDVILRSYPESLYTLFLTSESWKPLYSGGHLHFICYFLGLAGGYFYYKNVRVGKTSYNLSYIDSGFVQIILATLIFTVLLSPYFFYIDGFEISRLLGALYHTFMRITFGLPIIYFIFIFSIGKGGKIRRFFEADSWKVLAKLSFSVYLSHGSFMRYRIGDMRTPMYYSSINMIVCSLGDICLSYIIATVVYLFVELPFRSLQKILIGEKPRDKID